ncbi:laminin subunit alpha-1-like [Pollicipes pollicipes]|uniref:laminin subunit alpha-1-like n=1 Tax=Pollicipes pollicipes TaxID=41117 RepID=UPI001884A45F|nr:laminin subunit alpha-1-like [Pollicipes pollicipes]
MEFDAPLRHQHVSIGRCNGDLLRGRMLHEMASEPDPTSCNKPSQITLEARAVKLGDDPFSHVYVPVRRRDLKADFNITLDFRTFAPNGMLLHSEGKTRRRSSYLSLGLRDGAVQLTVRRGRRTARLTAGSGLNDGNWQMATLVRTRRKYTLLVGGAPPASRRGPRSFRAGRALYVGGVPRAGIEQRGRDANSLVPGRKKLEMLQTEGFKGCMKQLSISGRDIDLPSGRNIIHRVGQCMARVEMGTFFAGDAFATYADGVVLGDKFDLRLDFRTAKLNGVLASLAGAPGAAALSLEIADGEVVFSVDDGSGEALRARQKFSTKYILCDNQWHSARATYTGNKVTLRLDQLPQRTVSARGGAAPPWAGLSGALYVGGLPDAAPNPTLLQTDNFKGCIRDVELNGVRRRWSDMAQLTNVLLNSCPVQR